MKKTRVEIGTLLVELTRKCNMKCGHCLRGPAQNKEMSDEVMDAMFAKMRGHIVNRIGPGGGESTLSPERMTRLVNHITSYGDAQCFEMTTNGKRMPAEFGDALVNLANCIDSVYVARSDDNLHDRINLERYFAKTEVIAYESSAGMNNKIEFGDRFTKRFGHNNVLRMGRGKNWGTCGVEVGALCVKPTMEDYLPLTDDMLYVDVDGNVWPACDLSYKFMRERKEYSLGNVTDPDFDWYAAAVEFNVRHADKLPVMLYEPGYERNDQDSLESWMKKSSQEQIKHSIKIIKKLKKKGETK